MLSENLSYTFEMPAENDVYTAKWAQMTLNKNLNEAGTITQVNSTYTAGQEMTITATTNRGYTWLGWYNGDKELSRESEYTFAIPAEDVIYTAKWGCYTATIETEEGGVFNGLSVKVSFDVNGGTGTIEDKIVTNAQEPLYPVPTRSGYIFTGWYMNSSCTTRYNYGTAIEDGTVLYAGWKATESVTNAHTKRVINIVDNYNTQDNAYSENLQYTSTSSNIYTHFAVYTTGDYSLYFKGSQSRSMNIYIYNATQRKVIKASTEFNSTTYQQVAFKANAGDVIYVKSYLVTQSGSYAPQFYFYVTGGQYPVIATANPVESLNIAAGTELTVTASTQMGYTWLGWYDGEKKLTENLSYTFTMPYESVSYKAKWKLLDGLELFTFESTAESFTITGIKDKNATEIVIPDFVTAIGQSAFRECWHLRKVTIGRGVKSFGSTAFFDCGRLTEVYNFSSVKLTLGSTSYGYVAYYAENIYTEATDSHIVTTADEFVFYEDENVSYLIDYLGDGGNEGEERILRLPAKSPSGKDYAIRQYAFYKNDNVVILNISSGVTSIGRNAFEESNLNSVLMPDSITQIEKYAFKQCKSLEYVSMGKGIKTIEEEAFYNCSVMRISELPSGLTSIGAKAFYACGQLRDIVLSDSVTELGAEAFRNSGVVNLKIGSGITKIEARTFETCHRLTTVVVGKNVAEIGANAFIGCVRLIEVCNLSSLTITQGATTYGRIAGYAKYVSKSATDTKIQKSGDYVFYINGVDVFLVDYAGNVSMAKLTLPATAPGEKAYTIYKFAFYGNREIASVVIPDTVTIKNTEGGIFYGCTYLSSVTLGKNITQLNPVKYTNTALTYDQNKVLGFFENCVNLVTVNMDNLTYIGTRAFYHCDKFADIVIGNNVTFIGEAAFGYCQFTSVTFMSSNNWKLYYPGESAADMTISAATLKDPSEAAALLSRYSGREWRRA